MNRGSALGAMLPYDVTRPVVLWLRRALGIECQDQVRSLAPLTSDDPDTTAALAVSLDGPSKSMSASLGRPPAKYGRRRPLQCGSPACSAAARLPQRAGTRLRPPCCPIRALSGSPVPLTGTLNCTRRTKGKRVYGDTTLGSCPKNRQMAIRCSLARLVHRFSIRHTSHRV